jgi:DNA-directed RNA polymerase subunit RPC12/RpoP
VKQNGLLITCDRCNASIFLKCTSTTFGGEQWINKFEDSPTGWEVDTNMGDLCPSCSKEYEQLKKEFLKEAQKKVRRDRLYD